MKVQTAERGSPQILTVKKTLGEEGAERLQT
jgi:hypothetical protein